MARNEPQISLRIPPQLKQLLDDSAWSNRRSLTAEVVDRLARSFELDQSGQVVKDGAGAYARPPGDRDKVRRLLIEALEEMAPEKKATPSKPRRAKPARGKTERR